MISGLLKSQVSIGEPDARRLQEILGNYPEVCGPELDPNSDRLIIFALGHKL